MSLGALKATNYQNSETLPHGTFLLWGDNNQSFSFKEADLLPHILSGICSECGKHR